MKVDPQSVVVHEASASFTTVDFDGEERTIYEQLDPDRSKCRPPFEEEDSMNEVLTRGRSAEHCVEQYEDARDEFGRRWSLPIVVEESVESSGAETGEIDAARRRRLATGACRDTEKARGTWTWAGVCWGYP
jgi:hypothetical protein